MTRQHCEAPDLSRKLAVMKTFKPLVPRGHRHFFKLAAAAALFTAVLPLSRALGQPEQDGMGRVEFQDGASDAVPNTAPPVRSAPIRAKNGQPVVGRKAAEKYMGAKKTGGKIATQEVADAASENHIMTVHIGSFVTDHAYKWGGNNSIDNSANLNFGLSYRFGEWTNVADISGAVEYTTFSLRGNSVQKLTLWPKLTFPDVSSHFPLYFGLGAGLGIFTKQLHAESAISLDYTVFAGVRFLNVFSNTGFFVETGLKNHLLILSDGQFNGWFLALGAIFAF